MDFMNRMAAGRQTFQTTSRAWFASAALALLAMLSLGWSSQALAQSCDFVTINDIDAINPANTQVSFVLEAQTACSTTVNVALAITSDTTGGATIQAPTNPTVFVDTQYTFTVNLGNVPGGTGTVTATCLSGGCAGDVLTYTFNTNNSYTYSSPSSSVITNQITPATLSTNFQFNGAPGTLPSDFNILSVGSAGPPVTPDAAGTANIAISLPVAGIYTVTADIVCPLLFSLEGCPPPTVFYSVDVEPVSVIATTSLSPATTPGVPVPMAITYGSPSIPAPNGTPFNWTVIGQPLGGNGAVAGSPIVGGASTATFTASVPGVYTVLADSLCTPCAVPSQSFTVTVTAIPYVLVPVSPNPLAGTAGVGLPVTVRLEQGGTPVPGATVQWSASTPFAPLSATSTTNAGTGEATATFTPSTFGSFTNAIVASVDVDGIPATGDEATLSFDANIAFVASLAQVSGDNQNALVSTPFTNPLQVNAQNSGAPAGTVTIDWVVVSGSAVLSAPTSITDTGGNAAIGVTAGAVAGPVVVRGTRQDDPASTVSFNLTVNALGELKIVGGNGQVLGIGVASAPLQVVLTDSASNPIVGSIVSWTTNAGTLASATSSTDNFGIASNTVTAASAGAVQVTATSPVAAAPAVFALNGALASIGGLSETQLEVAQAIDSACPALAALPALTAGQQDLLLRCQELAAAAGINPGATIAALDQLMADVALTQANAAFSAAQSQFINLKTRIAALRSGAGGVDFGGLAVNSAMGPVSLGTLAGAFSNSAAEPTGEVGSDFSRWGFFAAGTIGRGEAKAGSVNPAYDFDVEGITAGVDYRKSDRWVLGGSFGYTRQDTVLPGDRGGMDTTGWSLSAYSTYYQAESWYLDGLLTYGRNDYELLRKISYTLPLAGGGTTQINQLAKSNAGGDLLSSAFTVGRDFNVGGFGIGPYGRVMYTRLGFDAIDEKLQAGVPGSGLGLRIENRDVTSLVSVLGTKFTYTHSTDWGVLMPHMQLEWEHEFKDDPQSMEARFINDPTGKAMVISGDPLDTNYFRVGLGLSMVLTRGRSGFFYYERLAGMNGMSQYSLALGFRMEF